MTNGPFNISNIVNILIVSIKDLWSERFSSGAGNVGDLLLKNSGPLAMMINTSKEAKFMPDHQPLPR